MYLFGYLVLHYHLVFNQFSVWAAKGVIWFWSMHSETALPNSPQASSFIWSYSKCKFAEILSYYGWKLLYIFHLWLIWLSIRFNEACLQLTLNHTVMCTIDITFCSLHVSSPLLRCGATMLFRNVLLPNLYNLISRERWGLILVRICQNFHKLSFSLSQLETNHTKTHKWKGPETGRR